MDIFITWVVLHEGTGDFIHSAVSFASEIKVSILNFSVLVVAFDPLSIELKGACLNYTFDLFVDVIARFGI